MKKPKKYAVVSKGNTHYVRNTETLRNLIISPNLEFAQEMADMMNDDSRNYKKNVLNFNR